MANHGMLVCSFRIKQRHEQTKDDLLCQLNETFEVDRDDVEGSITFVDIIEFLQSFCYSNNIVTDDKKKQKLFCILCDSIKTHDESTYRAISFIIRSGNYGIEAQMVDRITGEETHKRNENEAAMMDFRCVVYVPKDVEDRKIRKGIMIFESVSVYGVKTITTDYLRKFFSLYGLIFETRSVSVKIFMDKLIEKGSIQKIVLIKNKASPNEADNMLISSGKEVKSYLQPCLKPKFVQKMLNWFDEADKTGICEIPSSENFDDLSITFQINKHPRTIRLKNLDKMSIIEDIPEDIYKQSDFHEKLISYMLDTADDYKSKMILT